MRIIRTGLFSSIAYNVIKTLSDGYTRETNCRAYTNVGPLFNNAVVCQLDSNEVALKPYDTSSECLLENFLDAASMPDSSLTKELVKTMVYLAESLCMKQHGKPMHRCLDKTVAVKAYSSDYSYFSNVDVAVVDIICVAHIVLGMKLSASIPHEYVDKVIGVELNPVAYEAVCTLRNEIEACIKQYHQSISQENSSYSKDQQELGILHKERLKQIEKSCHKKIDELNAAIAAVKEENASIVQMQAR